MEKDKNILEQEPKFRTIEPENRPSLEEWKKQFKVSSTFDHIATPWWRTNMDNYRNSIVNSLNCSL